MRILTPYIIAIALCAPLHPLVCPADEIVLNSGERFSSDKIWNENGKVRFNMHGLIVSVDPADVVSIIRDNPAAAPQAPVRQTAPILPAAPTHRKHPPAGKHGPVEPASIKAKAAKSPTQPTAAQSPRVRGIGIDGIEWQMRPSEIQGLEKIKTDPAYGGLDQYARSEGSLRMGDALLDGLVFGFWQQRLYTITIWVDGKPAYERLQRAVFHRYGKGQKNKAGLERYIWLEQATDRLLEFDNKLNTGIFWMRSRDLDRHVKQRYPE